jgi:UDP-glucose 4-epimerase
MGGGGPRVPVMETGGRQLLGRGPIHLGDMCLVTGGAGFIGANLVHALVRQGMRVRVFDDLSTGRLVNLEDLLGDVDFVEGDVRDAEAVHAATQGAAVVFHLAAAPSVARSIVDPRTTHEVNVTGTLNVLVAARDSGCQRVVAASSSAVYGEQPTVPLHEEMVCRPISPYGVSKLAGERYLHAFHASYGLPTVALRLFNVFGPRQNPLAEYAAVVPRFVERTLAREPVTIFGDGEQSRDFVYVGDVVQACLLAANSSPDAWGGAFNVALGDRHTVSELAATIASVIGGVSPSPRHAEARTGDVRQSVADITEVERVLGYAPEFGFEDGIRRTVAWFAEQRDFGML